MSPFSLCRHVYRQIRFFALPVFWFGLFLLSPLHFAWGATTVTIDEWSGEPTDPKYHANPPVNSATDFTTATPGTKGIVRDYTIFANPIGKTDVNFSELIFKNNSGASSPALRFESLSTGKITNVDFENNDAGTDFGGAMCVHNSRIDAQDVTFSDNKAGFAGALHLNLNYGSGEINTGSRLTNVFFVDNIATASGGGLYIDQSSGNSVVNSFFLSNQGGLGGGAALISTTNNIFSNAIFDRNKANMGGGTHLHQSSGNAFVDGTLFTQNEATADGGGIYLSGGGTNLFTGNFQQNKAGGDGGGAVLNTTSGNIFDGGVFESNTARGNGGGVMITGGTNNIFRDVIFHGNHADGLGGAIYVGNARAPTSFTLEVTNDLTWSSNTAGTGADRKNSAIHFANTVAEVAVTLDIAAGKTLDMGAALTSSTNGARTFLVKGGGTWKLDGAAGANPLTNSTFRLENGTLALNNLDVLRSTGNTAWMDPNGVLELSVAAQENIQAAVLQGTGFVVKKDAGELNLSGAGTFSGKLDVQGGSVKVDTVDSLLHAASIHVGSGTKFGFDLAADGAFSAPISGDGGLEKTGIGTLNLSGSDMFSGKLDIQGGSVKVETVNSLLHTASIHVGTGTTLGFNLATDEAFSTPISGDGGVDKTGAGTLIMEGVQDYAGPTFVGEGTLEVRGKLNNTSVSVARDATLHMGQQGAIESSKGLEIQSGGILSVYLNAANHDTGRIRLAGGSGGTSDTVALSSAGGAGRIAVALADDVFGMIGPGQSTVLRIADGADAVTVDGAAATTENLAPLRDSVTLADTNAQYFFKPGDEKMLDKSTLVAVDDALGAATKTLGLRISRASSDDNPGFNPGKDVNDAMENYGGGNPLIQDILNAPLASGSMVAQSLQSALHLAMTASPLALADAPIASVALTRGMKARQSYSTMAVAFQPFASSALAGMADDGFGRGIGVWASPLYVRQETRNMRLPGSPLRTGAKTDLAGGMWGADLNRDDFRLGVAVSAGTGRAVSSGDFAKTKSDLEYKGATFYGGYLWGNFGLGGTLHYGRISSNARQAIMVGELESRIRNDVLGVSVKAEYALATRTMGTFTPHIGVEYIKIQQPATTTKLRGQDVVRTGSGELARIRVPVGISWTRPFTVGNVNVTPEVHAEYLPSFGDRNMTHAVSLVGNSRPVKMRGPTLDDSTGKAGFVIEASGKNLSFNFGYDALLSSHRLAHSVTGSVRWTF